MSQGAAGKMRDQQRFGILLVLAGILFVYVAIQSQLPHATFWSNDAGEKLLQVRALVENGALDPAIPYDPLGVEPPGSFEFAPLLPKHAAVVDGRLIPIVHLHFPLLSSLPYRLLGEAGLYVFPIIFSLLTLAALARLAHVCLEGPARLTATLTAGLATPIFFYSLTFWEHTMAMCMATLGIFFLFRAQGSHRLWNAQACVAGCVMAVGGWVRGDVYIMIVAVVAGLALTRCYRVLAVSFVAGVVLGLVPHFLVNLSVYGNLFGPQVTGRVTALGAETTNQGYLVEHWRIVRYLFLARSHDVPINLLCFAVGVAPAAYFIRIKNWTRQSQQWLVAWGVGLLATTAYSSVHIFLLDSPMVAGRDLLGLWMAVPILPFAFAGFRFDTRSEASVFTGFLAVVAGTCLLGFSLGLPSKGGLQWGPRYTLALFPVLILLSFRGYAFLRNQIEDPIWRRAFQLIFVMLILLGAAIQGYGIQILQQKKLASAENARRIEAMAPTAIVTDSWWLPEENADLYDRVPMYQVRDNRRIGSLLKRILLLGEQRVLLVSQRNMASSITKSKALTLLQKDRTNHKDLHFYDLHIFEIGLADAPATDLK
jgi:hypothetical protein